MSPFPTQMADHWAIAPETDAERQQLMWPLLFGRQPQVAELVRIAQERLAGLPGLDLVPPEWLHVTTLTSGFADELQPAQITDLLTEARRLVQDVRPVTITLGRVLFHPRALMLDAGPAEALRSPLAAVRTAVRMVTGRDTVLYHGEGWRPHITLAYSNRAQPAAPLISALGQRLPERTVVVDSISLVAQAPIQRARWDLLGDVSFGSPAGEENGER